MSLRSLLNTTVTLERPTVTKDAVGGTLRTTWTAVVSDAPASVQPVSGNDRHAYMQRNIRTDFKVYTETDLGALPGDRILLPSGAYLIVSGHDDQAGRGRVFCLLGYQKDL